MSHHDFLCVTRTGKCKPADTLFKITLTYKRPDFTVVRLLYTLHRVVLEAMMEVRVVRVPSGNHRFGRRKDVKFKFFVCSGRDGVTVSLV
jgi:hypothetical protein